MALIPKFYIDAVVSVGVRQVDNSIAWTGTGFFVNRRIDDERIYLYLVSNKHVFEGKASISIRMAEKKGGELLDLDIDLNGYKTHPFADIAAVLITGKFIDEKNVSFSSFDIDEDAYSTKQLLDNGVDEGSLVYMLGFPMGLVNVNSKLPICRLGCIARISEEQVKEERNVMLDIQNFPGNSGSPIVNRPELAALNGSKSLKSCVLIGIVHSYIPYRENLVNMQTKQVVEVRSENSGIAWMHPVEYIREVIDMIYVKPAETEKLCND